MSILFINGSPNKNGNTVALARELLKEKQYETIDLVEYKIYSYGQEFEDDQFSEILDKIKQAQIIVIGSPVYWHNMSGAVRTVLDRVYGSVEKESLKDKELFFLFQGAAPTQEQKDFAQFTINRFAIFYGMTYIGMATNSEEAKKLAEKVK